MNPTYAVLIDLLVDAEQKAHSTACNLSEVLVADFKELYPQIEIGRADRFLDTVRRIAAPTKSSSLGSSRLAGSPLRTYLNRTWIPRIRNKKGMVIMHYRFNVIVLYSVCIKLIVPMQLNTHIQLCIFRGSYGVGLGFRDQRIKNKGTNIKGKPLCGKPGHDSN